MATPTPIIPREQVAEKLAIAPRVLVRYEARGLIQALSDGGVEGYRPSEIRRIWTILSFQRDLGINLAGVEALLKLQDHMAQVHERLNTLVQELSELASDAQRDSDGPRDG